MRSFAFRLACSTLVAALREHAADDQELLAAARARPTGGDRTHPPQQGPCSHCQAATSVVWRTGPPHAPVLCNTCGASYHLQGFLHHCEPQPAAEPAGVAADRDRCSNCGSEQSPRFLPGPPDLPLLCERCAHLHALGQSFRAQGSARRRRFQDPEAFCFRCGSRSSEPDWLTGNRDWPVVCHRCYPLIQGLHEAASAAGDAGEASYAPYVQWKCWHARRKGGRGGSTEPAVCAQLNAPDRSTCKQCHAQRCLPDICTAAADA